MHRHAPSPAFLAALLLVLSALAVPARAPAQGPDQPSSPAQIPVTQALVDGLRKPAGFSVSIFANPADGYHPRMLAVGPDGALYATYPYEGTVRVFRDTTGSGAANQMADVFTGLPMVHGIAIADGAMYLASTTTVWRADMAGGQVSGQPVPILTDLPNEGGHVLRTVGVGPDGMLYISVGSSCNACQEDNAELAAILRAATTGLSRAVFASGLRNAEAFAWHPVSREMWAMDNGRDGLGNDLPPEELNRVVQGRDYGWPFAYGDRVPDPTMPEPTGVPLSKAQYAARSEPPVLGYTAHSAPLSMAFYTGPMFPTRYANGAFVAFHGSWDRTPPSGYRIAFLPFDSATNQPTAFEDFVTGFLSADGATVFSRPAGLAVGRDGALFVSDDTGGVIYRIFYTPMPPGAAP